MSRPEISDRLRRVLHIDALESFSEQGLAPTALLDQEAVGGGRTASRYSNKSSAIFSSDAWASAARFYLGSVFEHGNDIRRLLNGDEIFVAMLASIRSATRSIEFLSFIFQDDAISEQFCDALIDRANAGVQVRVVMDAFGGKAALNSLISKMQENNIRVVIFHPVSSWKFWRTSSRNHRKILVVDNRVAYTGGVGVSNSWRGKGDGPDNFRDTHFRITGPAVGRLKAAFFTNWASAGGKLPDPTEEIPLSTPRRGGNELAAVLPSSSGSRYSTVSLMFQLLVRCATNSLYISTPYFVPGDVLVRELINASRRGVQIEIMLSGKHCDHRSSLWAGRNSYKELLAAGISIYEYDRTLLHTKAYIVDRRLVVFGSPNMNQRSQSMDEEIAMLALSSRLAEKMLEDMEQDRMFCREINQEKWSRRAIHKRLIEKTAAMFSSQL